MYEDTAPDVGMVLAIIPSCDTYESHFGKLGVEPEELANGSYRGSWIVQYAKILARAGVRVNLVVPTLGNSRVVIGPVMTVDLVPVTKPYRVLQRFGSGFNRSKLRIAFSALSSYHIFERLVGGKHDCVYIQEYATGRYITLSHRLGAAGVRFVAGYHGTSLTRLGVLRRCLNRGHQKFSVLTADEKSKLYELGVKRGIFFIPNPIEDSWFQYPIANTGEGISRVVWVGRLERRAKGLELLLNVVSEFRGDCRHHFTIVGDGPDKEWFESRIATEGLAQRVSVVGRLESVEEMAQILCSSSAILNTSRVEGFPISIVEAMSMGCGVVASDLPYVRTELSDAPLIASYEFGDSQEAARLVRKVCLQHGNEVAEWQRRWVWDRYSESLFAERLLEFIKPS